MFSFGFEMGENGSKAGNTACKNVEWSKQSKVQIIPPGVQLLNYVSVCDYICTYPHDLTRSVIMISGSISFHEQQ